MAQKTQAISTIIRAALSINRLKKAHKFYIITYKFRVVSIAKAKTNKTYLTDAYPLKTNASGKQLFIYKSTYLFKIPIIK
ncbi:MAG: hypothetical protein ACI921_000323 [Polaribacter sp.]